MRYATMDARNKEKERLFMNGKGCIKKMIAGISAFAVGASTILPAAPVLAAPGASDSMNLTKERIAATDYVLYTVNCGTSDAAVVPNQNSERMGLLQSSVDQNYGTDVKTGTVWGCDPADEYSQAVKHAENATDIGYSFVYMSDSVKFDKDKSALGYSFEVPTEKIDGIEENTYEVTVAFKHYWDEKVVNVCLEGETVATDITLKYGEWVSRTFTTTVTDGELNVQVKSPRRTSAAGDPILNYIKVRAVEEKEPVIPRYSSITGVNGDAMYDTNGKLIQAHGGQVQQLTVDGVKKWYWVGEDKTNDYRPCAGIHVYSSEDLYNWDDEGVVLRTMESMSQFEDDEYFSSLYGDYTQEQKEAVFVDIDKNNCVMERPKMLYNDKTGKYVIWFHADGRYPGSDADYGKAKAGIAVSDSPTGPFKLLGSYKLNYVDGEGVDHGFDSARSAWGSVRDMNLFKDDDGTAYVVYSSDGNKTTYISKLNEEYTGLATEPDKAVEGVDFTRNFINWSREAPAMFKYKDKYYIINSGCTGWSPNPAQYAVADNPLGPWTSMGDPCSDEGKNTTYDTQSTCVIPVDAENGKFIYMGDRWNAGDLSESRYVWLPIEFQPENQIVLRRYANWTLDELEGKGLFDIETELPNTVESAAEIPKVLPEKIVLSYGNEKEETSVTWEIGEYEENKLGTVTVQGTLTEKGRTFTHRIHVVDSKTKFFFDSGAKNSEYFNAVQAKVGTKLQNTVPDQKYTEESGAGYTGVTQEENGGNYDLGRHDGTTLLENGWWAASGKEIAYAFRLNAGTYTIAAGFQEWWNTTRYQKMTISMGDKVLAEQEFTLPWNSKDLQVRQEFEVSEPGIVTVSIRKTKGADPVLSWIAVLGESENPPADVKLDSLLKAIEKAEGLEQTQKEEQCYTKESWDAVEKALNDARAILKQEEITQKEVDDAFLTLTLACNLLEYSVQKVGLKAAIDGAEELLADTEELEQYQKESVQALKDALQAAKLIYENKDASQSEVNLATTNLVTAVNALVKKLPYQDVSEKDWFYQEAAYTYRKGIMEGLTPDTFGSAETLNRAQAAVVLWRMAGKPKSDSANVFPDVQKDSWYADAANWAAEEGIVTGYMNGLFGPGDVLTREQAVTILWRFAKAKGMDVSVKAELGDYQDGGSVQTFAREAMQWAVGNKIVKGKDEKMVLVPQGSITRAEYVVIVTRFMKAYME